MERGWSRGRTTAHLTLAVAVLAAAACSATTHPPGNVRGSTPDARGTIQALSYNVAGLPEGLSGSHPAVNIPLISPKLNAYDLVLVQEDWVDPDPPIAGLDFHHDDLVSAADHPYRSTPAAPPMGADPQRRSALVADGLNLLSRHPLGDVTRVRWAGCFGAADTSDGGAGDCLALKGFTLNRVTLAPGVDLDVYNVHAEAGGTPTDQQLQADDFRQLAAHIIEHSAGRAVILGGDTNLHTDGVHPDSGGSADREIWRSFLAATGLSDVCDTVECDGDAAEIDKFALRSSPGLQLTPVARHFEDDVFVDPDGRPLSDHRALALTLDWSVTG